jgi:hypothetical protein
MISQTAASFVIDLPDDADFDWATTLDDPESSGTLILVSDAGRIDRVTTPVSTSSGPVPATL